MAACVSPKRHLSEEPYKDKILLNKQQVKGNKQFSDFELSEYYQKQTNRFLFARSIKPYLRAYLIGKKSFDPEEIKREKAETDSIYLEKIAKLEQKDDRASKRKVNQLIRKRNKKINQYNLVLERGNWLMRVVGEPPSFYDSVSIAKTARQIQLFYQSKGFFLAEVYVEKVVENRKADITYTVKKGTPYKLKTITYSSDQEDIKKILVTNKKASFLKKGNNYSVSKISKERERINTLLKDYGYYRFHRQYVYFKVDTTVGRQKVNIEVMVNLPVDSTINQTYKINDLYLIIDKNTQQEPDTVKYNGTTFIADKNFKYSPRILDYQLKIKPGQFYNYTNTVLTQNLLGSLDAFKFININYRDVADSLGLLNTFITVNTFKKYSLTSEIGVNVNVNVNQGQRIPGPVINLKFTNRRFFKGFEVFDINARYSIQGQVGITQQNEIYPTQEMGLNSTLTFPIFLFQDILFPEKFKQKFSNYRPKTILSLGITDIRRLEYQRTTINYLTSYTWQKKEFHRYAFNPIDLNVIDTNNVSSDFIDYLEFQSSNGVNIRQSFIPSFVSSINFGYTYSDINITQNKKSKFLRLFLESGGTSVTVSNLLVRESQRAEVLGLPYYQFYKVSTEGRYYFPVSRTATIASKLGLGIAQGYGNYRTLPYEKFFFLGGINSVRAWNPRRLGPGSSKQLDENGNLTYRFEQPGEIMFESSVELRSQLFSFIHGAVFVDIGNVWTIDNDETRTGAQWQLSTFLNEIAVGSGLGIRLDFSYIIMRVDMGIKVWDPARQMVVPLNDKFSRVYNIGLGYPF